MRLIPRLTPIVVLAAFLAMPVGHARSLSGVTLLLRLTVSRTDSGLVYELMGVPRDAESVRQVLSGMGKLNPDRALLLQVPIPAPGEPAVTAQDMNEVLRMIAGTPLHRVRLLVYRPENAETVRVPKEDLAETAEEDLVLTRRLETMADTVAIDLSGYRVHLDDLPAEDAARLWASVRREVWRQASLILASIVAVIGAVCVVLCWRERGRHVRQ